VLRFQLSYTNRRVLARHLLLGCGMRSVDTISSWSSRGMGGKITSGSAHPPGAPLTPPSTHPAPFRRGRPAWLDRLLQHSDYFYLAGVIAVVLLAAYILIFDV
jgi:hypothetical protein